MGPINVLIIEKRLFPGLIFVLFAPFISIGCVSQSKYDLSVSQYQALSKQHTALENDHQKLKEKLDATEKAKQAVQAELDETNEVLKKKDAQLYSTKQILKFTKIKLVDRKLELQKTTDNLAKRKQELAAVQEELDKKLEEIHSKEQELEQKQAKLDAVAKSAEKTRALYEGMVGKLTHELADNQIKIKEMKDGIVLKLSEQILFSSGSAKLNKTGEEVIKKVSEQLKGANYLVEVSGHTDNIPIKGGLAAKYPTNWELAGARAAKVVNLLQTTGIDGRKLTAVSYADNAPVADNDTPEGRAQNRRIEIKVRPIE